MNDLHRQFEIDPSSGVPIYRQIIDQVLALIASGRLEPGQVLPSVRRVAREASVNPMTVSKAYARLEADGVVRRDRGRGMRVLPPAREPHLDERKRAFRRIVEPPLHRGRQLGLDDGQITEVIASILKNEHP